MKKLNVEELFPAEQQEQRLEVARRFWNGEDVGGDLYCTYAPRVQYRQLEDAGECVRGFLEALKVESGLPGQNIPAFFPDMGATMVASAFGGTVRVGEQGGVWLEPLVKEPADVDALSLPDYRAGRIGEGLRRYEMVLENVEGKVALRPPDLQGPLSTASLIWEQSRFMLAMYDAPEAVHRLLNLVTDYLIGLLHYVRSTYDYVLEPFWPFITIPPEVGCSITEDFMPLLPPELYREFGLPYTTRMAREFGGIYIHCCGRWQQHIAAIKEIPGLVGMDVAYCETDPEVVFSELPEHVVLNYGCSSQGAPEYPRYSDFLRWLLSIAPPQRRFFFLLDGSDEEELKRCIEIIEGR